MSFEFYGGMIALDILGKEGAPKAQAESVAEAVMRHQDLGDKGTLTCVGALVQLATIFGLSPSPFSALFSYSYRPASNKGLSCCSLEEADKRFGTWV
jgi:hypothetical protein